MKASVKSRAWSPRCLKSCPAPGQRTTAPFPSRGRRGRRRAPRRAPPWGAACGRPMVRPACRDWDFLVAESFLGDPARPACGRVGLNAPESKKAPGEPSADRASPPRPGIFFQGPPPASWAAPRAGTLLPAGWEGCLTRGPWPTQLTRGPFWWRTQVGCPTAESQKLSRSQGRPGVSVVPHLWLMMGGRQPLRLGNPHLPQGGPRCPCPLGICRPGPLPSTATAGLWGHGDLRHRGLGSPPCVKCF